MRRAPATALALLLGTLPAAADERPTAPPVDAQRFRVDPVGRGLPGMAGASLLPRGGVHLGVGLSTAIDPLEGAGEAEGALVSRLTTLDVGIAYGLGPADVFVSLPLHLDQRGGGEDLLDRPHLQGFGGPGDLSVGAVVRLKDVEELTFGLAFRLEAGFPTGDEDRALGWAGPTVRPALVTEFRAWILRFLTETSVHLRPPVDALGVAAHHALGVKLGVSITPTPPTELRRLEIAAQVELHPELGRPPGEVAAVTSLPVEWRVSIVGRPTPCLAVQGGAGTGIGQGWGTPRVRIHLGIDMTVGAEGVGCGDRSAL